MYQRDIPTLTRFFGLSVKEACDYSAAGFLRIIELLEGRERTNAWAKDALASERRAYVEKFTKGNVAPFPMGRLKPVQPMTLGEHMMNFAAKRAFG